MPLDEVHVVSSVGLLVRTGACAQLTAGTAESFDYGLMVHDGADVSVASSTFSHSQIFGCVVSDSILTASFMKITQALGVQGVWCWEVQVQT